IFFFYVLTRIQLLSVENSGGGGSGKAISEVGWYIIGENQGHVGPMKLQVVFTSPEQSISRMDTSPRVCYYGLKEELNGCRCHRSLNCSQEYLLLQVSFEAWLKLNDVGGSDQLKDLEGDVERPSTPPDDEMTYPQEEELFPSVLGTDISSKGKVDDTTKTKEAKPDAKQTNIITILHIFNGICTPLKFCHVAVVTDTYDYIT
ncbi:hypothetical protein MKW92_026667, partial [Papaver armeniacum]